MSGKSEPVFLAWRTAEQVARGLTYAEAKPRVLEAWKRAKARELAKAEAEKLAGELRGKPHSSLFAIEMDMRDMAETIRQRAADPKAKDRVKQFEVTDVAPLAITPDLTGRSGAMVRPFQVTPTTNIPYPTPDMTKVLLDDRAKPPRTVVVLPDQPKDTYYVFALADRREQTESMYRQYMLDKPGPAGPMGGGSPVRQEVRGAFQRDAMTRAKDSVVGLLKKEYNYAETPEQAKKLDDRDRRSSSED
jgi:hypothetical protein